MALVKRYAKLEPWLPTSSKMVLDYLKHKGYDIPKHRKTRKPTADEEALEKLLRKHPDDVVLPKVLEARRIQKGKGYFNDSHLGRDGRLHPEYTRHPETLRPSSRRPNLFNIPQGRKDAEALVAQAIRDTIEASPGFTLIERDYKAEESLLVGFFAGDENYMRMARLGIYTFFLARQLGQPIDMALPDAEIAKLLKPIKAAHPFEYALWKVIILAKGYGEGFYALAKQLEPFFWEQAKAEAIAKSKSMTWAASYMQSLAKEAARDYSAIYEREAPKVVKWQHDTRMRAHKERKLVNPYGYSRQWFDVFSKRRDGTWGPGSEANKVLAFLPQSTGAGILTEACLELDQRYGENPDFHMLIPLYDSITAECKATHKDPLMWQARMKEVMEAPIPALGGLVITTEGKWGHSWGSMTDCA